jgi:hypothetical protein
MMIDIPFRGDIEPEPSSSVDHGVDRYQVAAGCFGCQGP